MVTSSVEGVHAGTSAPRAPSLEVRQVGPSGVAGVADEEGERETLVGVLVGATWQAFYCVRIVALYDDATGPGSRYEFDAHGADVSQGV